MKQAYICKMADWSYDLVVTGLTSAFSIQPLATLNQQSYDMMIDCLQGLCNGMQGWYQFPRYDSLPDVQVVIQKYDVDSIVLHLQLGNITLSDMNDDDFQYLITELIELKNQPIGSKVYFV